MYDVKNTCKEITIYIYIYGGRVRPPCHRSMPADDGSNITRRQQSLPRLQNALYTIYKYIRIKLLSADARGCIIRYDYYYYYYRVSAARQLGHRHRRDQVAAVAAA